MKKFAKLLTAGLAALTIAVTGLAVTHSVYAEDSCTDICNCSTVSDQIKAASGCKNTSDKTAYLPDVVMNIVNSVLGILAVVAVIVIVIGGVQYMTSAGDATKTKKARDTILYAAIGLIIVALAAVIVNFVIGAVDRGVNGTTTTDAEEDALIPISRQIA